MLRFAIALALAPVATYAQETAPQQTVSQRGGGLQEIVVTAERREASLQTVPIAVTALNEEALTDRQVTESRDLARFTPSLKMFSNITSPTNLSPSMRGSLQQDASLIVAESPFGLYVDDVYLARLNGNNITLADIERVEVLRGPQGTLYGRNTLVGAIKFVSRTPGRDPWFKASIGAGNFEQYKGSLSVGGPLGGSDSWAGSFSALLTNTDGMFKNVNPANPRDTGLQRNWAARSKLHYMGSDKLDVVFSVSHSDAKNDAQQLIPGVTPNVPANRQFTSDDIVPGFYPNPMNPTAASLVHVGTYDVYTPIVPRLPASIKDAPEGHTQQTISSINLSYDLGWSTFKSITGYVNTKDTLTTDYSGHGTVVGSNNLDVDQFSEELQLVGKAADDRLSYIAGLYYFQETGDQAFGWNLGLPFSSSTIKAKVTSYSAFTQLDYNITEALKLTGGVRYTRDKKDFDFVFNGLLPPVTPVLGVVDLTNTYTQTTPKFGIDYTLPASGAIDRMLVYATAAQGFKSGGYNGIAIADFKDARTPYGPETNWTYEVGIKTDLLGNRLRINANYFFEKAKDLTLNATVTDPVTNVSSFPVQNAGDATVKGLEFEVTAVPVDNLTLFMNGSLLDGKYDRVDPTSAPAMAPANYNVQPTVPQTPDYTVTVGFDYGIDTSVGRVKFGADWFFQDDYVSAATNDFRVQPYNIGNAFASVGFKDHWTAKAAVKNLADEAIIPTGSRALNGFVPLPRRTWLLSLDYSMN